MAGAFAVNGSQQGPCVAASVISGHKPGTSNFSSNGYFRSHPVRGSGVVPSMAWSMDQNTRRRRLKAQGRKRTLQSKDYLYNGGPLETDDADFLNPFAPGIHIDLLNRMSVRSPLLERTKAVVAEQREQRLKAFQQYARKFADGLMQHISSSNDNYKYVITATKENANMIMEQDFISSSARDEILNGLERIEKDIVEGRFEWRNNVDVRTNIIEELIEIVGGPAERLDATISHYVQQLTVLQIWCHDSIDKTITQIKELQLELILLAIRNDGLVLPSTWVHAKWFLLGDLVLLRLEQLERDVSRLLSCKSKMDSMLPTFLPLGNAEDSKNSLSKDSSGHIHNHVINFGNTIIGDIAHDLSNLERDLASWMEWHLLTPNDKVTRSGLLMNKYMRDMDKFTAVRSTYSIYNAVEESSERFLGVYKTIPEILKAARDFAKSSSFNHEKIQNFPPAACFFPSDPAGLRGIKELDQSQSDDTRRKLLNWLIQLQSSVRKN